MPRRFDADVNARSLGGHVLADGAATSDAIWRSAAPDRLGDEGRRELVAAGVRRIVDLRNADERDALASPPPGVDVVHAPLEDPTDPAYEELWSQNWAHPDFYAWGIGHWAELWRAAFEAVADAPTGGVLIHCAGGRDRTGMLSAVLLELAGVPREEVLDDYVAGLRGTNEMLRRRGEPDHPAAIPEERMADIESRFRAALDRLLDELPERLRDAGLEDVAARAARRLRA